MSTHQRQEPFCADRKTYTKPSTFVKYVIRFADVTNAMHILSLCGPHTADTADGVKFAPIPNSFEILS